MKESPSNLGLAAAALISIACCVGFPLIVAAGISLAVVAWAGGIAIAALVLIVVVLLLVLRVRRRRECAPLIPIERGRS